MSTTTLQAPMSKTGEDQALLDHQAQRRRQVWRQRSQLLRQHARSGRGRKPQAKLGDAP